MGGAYFMDDANVPVPPSLTHMHPHPLIPIPTHHCSRFSPFLILASLVRALLLTRDIPLKIDHGLRHKQIDQILSTSAAAAASCRGRTPTTRQARKRVNSFTASGMFCLASIPDHALLLMPSVPSLTTLEFIILFFVHTPWIPSHLMPRQRVDRRWVNGIKGPAHRRVAPLAHVSRVCRVRGRGRRGDPGALKGVGQCTCVSAITVRTFYQQWD
jgi:hypothetical protein